MSTEPTLPNDDRSAAQSPEVRFAANDVRLSPRGWIVAALLIAGAFWAIPAVWRRIEPLTIGPDDRVPYRLGYDYWNYQRTCQQVCAGEQTLLIGDSVVWGHYVAGDQTLSHCLNQQAGGPRFANLGIDGIHPVALAGLVRYYGGAIRGKRVLVNCNLLWMSSPRHDLSADEESAFNHPGLVPQFLPRIPAYKASASQRLGIVFGRQIGLLGWADHLRIAYFGGDNLATWTFAHPYENPLDAVTLALPSPDEPPSPEPDARPWTEKGIGKVAPEWVELDASLQWRFFRQTIRLLQERGNRVFVLIGPLNEAMLSDEALPAYARLSGQVAAWLAEQGIPHYAPPALPSQANADLSHPTAKGYELLAEQLFAQEPFTQFLASQADPPSPPAPD